MRYIVLESDNLMALTSQVTQHLNKGWALQGGVAVTRQIFTGSSVSVLYAQAMVSGYTVENLDDET